MVLDRRNYSLADLIVNQMSANCTLVYPIVPVSSQLNTAS